MVEIFWITFCLPPPGFDLTTENLFCPSNTTVQYQNSNLHCKCFSRNLSGFYSCASISCTPVVLFTTVSWTQLIDVVRLQYIYLLYI